MGIGPLVGTAICFALVALLLLSSAFKRLADDDERGALRRTRLAIAAAILWAVLATVGAWIGEADGRRYGELELDRATTSQP